MKTYLKHKIHNVIDIKGLTALEYLDFRGKYKNYEEQHNFWELCYVENGKIMLVLEGKSVTLNEGEIFFIPPEKTHSYICNDYKKGKAFVVCFETFSHTMKTLGETPYALDEVLKDYVLRIISEYKQTFFMNDKDQLEVIKNANFGGQQAIILHLEYIIICILRKLSEEKNPEVVFLNKEDFYAKLSGIIIDYFQTNINRKISLEEICAKVNYSRSFLCKIFKEQMGESLFSYFNRMKIEEAKKLLSETDLSVTAVSKELGFSDIKYFGAFFKKNEGMSPAMYKKSIMKNTEQN
ncbi:MAG: helix-turn-helix domain-containing protein [Ruminococcaceae bacterium]|nr:helix-turn-helix domain-containing protein [Oscillospiraceae bacterium]